MKSKKSSVQFNFLECASNFWKKWNRTNLPDAIMTTLWKNYHHLWQNRETTIRLQFQFMRFIESRNVVTERSIMYKIEEPNAWFFLYSFSQPYLKVIMGHESVLHWLTHAGPNFPQGATWEHARNILQTYFQNITSLSAISSFVSSSLKDPSQLISLYKETDPLESSLYFSSALITVHYIMSEITKNYSQVGK